PPIPERFLLIKKTTESVSARMLAMCARITATPKTPTAMSKIARERAPYKAWQRPYVTSPIKKYIKASLPRVADQKTKEGMKNSNVAARYRSDCGKARAKAF